MNTANRLPRRDVLVVGNRHLSDVARYFRSDGDLARRGESIVGRVERGSVAPVDLAAPYRQRKEDRANHDRDWVPAPETLARLSAARAAWRGLSFCLTRQFRTLYLTGGALPRRSLRFKLLFPGRNICEAIVRRPIRRARNESRALNFLEHLLDIALQHDETPA